jgi:7-cyano-7-deazaguanine reductase
MKSTLLGRKTRYPQTYAPEVLQGLPRADARAFLRNDATLPFRGQDIWNAWELSWLDETGKPVVGTATITVEAHSPNLVESKSLKLYLNAFAMCRYASPQALQGIIADDLSTTTGAPVQVLIRTAAESTAYPISQLEGKCIDSLALQTVADDVSADLLQCESRQVTLEVLHSHLLRSNCPVTEQPDTGSILVRYSGSRIVPESLLAYIVSYRNHNDFHESCVERIFVDIKARCAPERLTVYARYNRRGGIDINPFRSDFEDAAENLRLWRQ